jgi:hypothetical protein
LRRNPGAPTAFNATLDGVWRSFFAGVALLPIDLAYAAYSGPLPGTEAASPYTRWAINILVYVIGWTAWPLAAVYVTRALDCGDRVLGYLAAYNWSQLISNPFWYGLDIFARAALPEGAAGFVSLVGLVAVLAYEYLIARQMLAVAPRRALLVVLSSFILVLVLRDATELALAIAAAGG